MKHLAAKTALSALLGLMSLGCTLFGNPSSQNPYHAAPIRVEDYPAPVRVACVGDSITAGNRVPASEKYPAQLGRLLGDQWEVRNFGRSGATMLKNQPSHSYWDHPQFQNATLFQPDVVIILLGSNDSKPAHWDADGARFGDDYKAMIRHFRNLPSRPRVWICLPPPAYSNRGNIRDDILQNEIIPAIQKVGKEERVPTINLRAPLSDPALYSDTIHPNGAGCTRIAETICEALTGEKRRENKAGSE